MGGGKRRASLRPSPTISTRRPAAFISARQAIFSADFNPARQERMPSASAIGATASRRSPDRICRSNPIGGERPHGLLRAWPRRLPDRQHRRAAAVCECDGGRLKFLDPDRNSSSFHAF
jgi:hypothetical protein